MYREDSKYREASEQLRCFAGTIPVHCLQTLLPAQLGIARYPQIHAHARNSTSRNIDAITMNAITKGC